MRWLNGMVVISVNQITMRYLARVFLIAAIALLLPGIAASHERTKSGPTQVQNLSSELQQDLARLDSLGSSRSLDEMESIVNRESVKWQQRDQQSFLTYMFKACSLLSSYDFGDRSKQALLLNRYAISVLTKGDLPLKDHVQFVEFLMQDPVTLDDTAWKKLREQKARLWLEAWRRAASSIDPNFDFEDLPLLNVAPPRATGLPAGVSPESIKDPRLRGEYENTIAANAAKANRYNEQYWLKQNASAFFRTAERYLINAYSMPPKDAPELEQLLNEYVSDAQIRNRILDAVKAR